MDGWYVGLAILAAMAISTFVLIGVGIITHF